MQCTLTFSASTTAILRDNTRNPNQTLSLTSLTVSKNMTINKCKWPKNCRYCPRLNKKDTVTRTTHESKTNITCNSSNLIYCMTCLKCRKQYVGQTLRPIKDRFRGHFGKIKNKDDRDAIGSHFSLPDHNGINDLEIYVLAFITPPPHSQTAKQMRDQVEKKWIHTLRCTGPYGLNIFD